MAGAAADGVAKVVQAEAGTAGTEATLGTAATEEKLAAFVQTKPAAAARDEIPGKIQRQDVPDVPTHGEGIAAPLDAASLILHPEMAELIRQAGDSLRQHKDDDRRGWRAWWRRFLG